MITSLMSKKQTSLPWLATCSFLLFQSLVKLASSNAPIAPFFLSDFFFQFHKKFPSHETQSNRTLSLKQLKCKRTDIERRVQSCSIREASESIAFHSLPTSTSFPCRVRSGPSFNSHTTHWGHLWRLFLSKNHFCNQPAQAIDPRFLKVESCRQTPYHVRSVCRDIEWIGWSWSHITTDSRSARPPWCRAPIWDPRPIFLSPCNFLETVAGLLFCSALSDERTGL
jgi:hypothetical protein